MTSYNFKSAIDFGWSPSWFGATKFGSQLLEKISEFQSENNLVADGFCGPKTFEVIKEQRKDSNYIVCGVNHIPINHKVVLWNDKKGLSANEGCYRSSYKQREVKLFVNHWDVARSSKDTISILNRKKISCQFLIDSNPQATIYQTMNADHIAWHSGGRLWNNQSIGVEVCNPFYLKYQDKKRPRPIIKGAKVHDSVLEDHLGFYPQQIVALKKLWIAINKAYQIPLQTPTKNDGSELGGVHRLSQKGEYTGYIHHYNLLRAKIDCSGLDLTELIDDINS